MLRLVLSGLMGALLVVSKQAMSGLPNIEPVTLLVILFALELPRETPGAVTVFILLQGVLYGFGLWWAMYLYVWYLLALLAWLLRWMDNALGWAVFSGIYGLCFGGPCAPSAIKHMPLALQRAAISRYGMSLPVTFEATVQQIHLVSGVIRRRKFSTVSLSVSPVRAIEYFTPLVFERA